LLASNRVGVVWRLVEACGRLRTRQQQIHAQLVEAMKEENKSLEETIQTMILSSQSKTQYINNKTNNNNLILSFDYLYCMFLRSWLQLSLMNEPILVIISSFNTEFLFSMSCDSNASRIIDAIMESSNRLEYKNKITLKLSNETLKLCKHRIGSFVLEKMFYASSIQAKKEIATKLSTIRPDNPNINKAQSVLLKKFAIEEFKHNQKVKIKSFTLTRSSHITCLLLPRVLIL